MRAQVVHARMDLLQLKFCFGITDHPNAADGIPIGQHTVLIAPAVVGHADAKAALPYLIGPGKLHLLHTHVIALGKR